MKTHLDSLSSNDIALLTIPFDAYSSHIKGCARGPGKIRLAMQHGSLNSESELGQTVKGNPRIKDLGNVVWQSDDLAFSAIEQCVSKVIKAGARPLSIGGDHSITFPILKSLAAAHQNITILHFDAHPDLYDSFKGNPLSHACPFARIMEAKLAVKLIQVGIRTLNEHQRQQANKFNVQVHEMKDWQGAQQLKITTPVYISIDLDALDPAFAPGVSHHEPGGLSVRQIIEVIHSIETPIVGADIVEYNPFRDINEMTATVAIKLYKEVCGKMLSN